MSRKDTVCVLICVHISVLICVLIRVHVCVLICVLMCSFYVPEGHCRAILSLFTACRDGYTRLKFVVIDHVLILTVNSAYA